MFRIGVVLNLMTATIEGESKTLRKVIAAVPNGNRDDKPDPRSRSAWEIAVHIAQSDIWFAECLMNGEFAWTGEPQTSHERPCWGVRGAKPLGS